MFTNKNWYITVNNVQELIDELKCLPPTTLIKYPNSENLDIVLINRDTEDVYLSFAEGGECEQLFGDN